MTPTARLAEIEKDLEGLLLASDDHGHDCTALREYCEQKLIEYSDNQIPWLIDRVRKLTEVLEVVSEKHENEASSELYLSTWQRLIRAIARKALDEE